MNEKILCLVIFFMAVGLPAHSEILTPMNKIQDVWLCEQGDIDLYIDFKGRSVVWGNFVDKIEIARIKSSSTQADFTLADGRRIVLAPAAGSLFPARWEGWIWKDQLSRSMGARDPLICKPAGAGIKG